MRLCTQTCLAAIATLLFAAAHASADRPNFVLFLADDLGYGDVGYQGGDVTTPNIDSIAEGGVVLTDGYVTCPVCAPSRAGLLTGRYQQTFGFWDNIGPFRVRKDVEPGIPPELPILSERLQALGYTCGLFGKTHDGEAEAMMAYHRWDEFFGFNNGASNYLGDMNRPANPIYHNREVVSSPYTERGIPHRRVIRDGVILRDEEEYLTDQLGDYASRFIETNKDRPFLCYVPFNAIHGPFQTTKALFDKHASEPNRQRRLVRAMVESMDDNVGKVLAALQKHDLEEKTLVVFLSDNGGHEASPNKPLRGKKGTFWEGGIRVPFCIRWPNKLPSGSSYPHPVSALDIMPTLITAAGGDVDPAWGLDGVDLTPFLTGDNPVPPHESLYWAWGPRKAIRHGDLKAVSNNNGRAWQLYDLAADISEQRDLSSADQPSLRKLKRLHNQWASTLTPQQWGWNADLGYRDPDFGKPREKGR